MRSVLFVQFPAFAGWPFRVASRFSLAGTRTRKGAAISSSLSERNGSGGEFNPPQNLTRPDLKWRSAMASTPDCRVVSASLSAPAGFSGFPVSPEPALSPALSLPADQLLQRQLDEWAAVHRRLRRLQAAWPAAGPAGFRRPRTAISCSIPPCAATSVRWPPWKACAACSRWRPGRRLSRTGRVEVDHERR